MPKSKYKKPPKGKGVTQSNKTVKVRGKSPNKGKSKGGY